ncbi:MAG TPA: ABC transporter permease [Kiritimatiellia bacterium]|nr:ABC transporter permease [Kiritimatiellia bacterium]HMO97973.1 ABC transporter permease [Kiritimatiellia bacterium]HMP95324.1 ABC transporter permease [Kiritimatiellia bacterium]
MNLWRLGEFAASGARNLLRHKLRSLLTLLGVLFGVAAVITMLGIGEGAQRSVMREISGLGLHNIIAESVQPTQPAPVQTQRRGPRLLDFGLTRRDAEQLRALLPEAEVTLTHVVRARVYQAGRRLDARVFGVRADYVEFFDTELLDGRLITPVDDRVGRRVAVVTENLMHLYHPPGGLAAQPLRIGSVFFDVVGVIRQPAKGSESMILIPYETARRTYGSTSLRREAGSTEFTRTEIGQIVMRFDSEDVIPAYADVIRRNLDANHPRGDYRLVVPLEILETKQRTQRILNLVLITIAAISLVVGGIGIMNIMLAVVTERIPEIGIRRALGATRRDILYQFLAETVTLSTVGGVLGCLCGFVLVPLAERFTGWSGVITPSAVFLSLAVSWLVGLVFGIAPAIRASRMDPVEALRYE